MSIENFDLPGILQSTRMPQIRSLEALKGTPHAHVFPGEEPRTVRLSLGSGDEIPSHNHPGRDIVMYVVTGRIEVHLDEETHELDGGDISRFTGEQDIAINAVEQSTVLVVLAQRST